MLNSQEFLYNRGRLQQRRSDEELQRLAKKHDFKGGPYTSKEGIQVLEKICANYVRSLSNTLSVRLGATVQVRMESISQMKYLDYMLRQSGQNATCTFTLSPLKESIYLNIDAQLAFLFINSICGGEISYKPINKSFTEVEKKLLEKLSAYFLSPLQQSMMDYIETKYEIKRMNFDFFDMGAIADHENIVAIEVHVDINDEYSFPVSLVLPYPAMEEILETVHKSKLEHKKNAPLNDENLAFLESQLKSSQVEMEIFLGNATLPISQFKNIKVGDVIKLDQKVEDLLPMVTQERTQFYVQPGTHHGNKLAVQVVEVLEK